MMKTKLFLAFAFLWATIEAGCGNISITVRVPHDLNGERPVRMLVRAVDRNEFVGESYGQVADRVVNRDESVLLSAPIYPDIVHVAKIKKPSAKGVAVYFFFTEPGAQWKTLLETPLPSSAEIKLSTNSIRSVKRL